MAFGLWFVVDGFDLGVVMGIASSEFEAGDLALREIDLAADESVRPGRVRREGVPQQRDFAVIVCAADVDHGSLEHALGIEGPHVGEGTATGSVLDADGRALMNGLHEAVGLLPDISQGT